MSDHRTSSSVSYSKSLICGQARKVSYYARDLFAGITARRDHRRIASGHSPPAG